MKKTIYGLTIAGLALTPLAQAQALDLQELDQRLRIAERELELSKEAADTAAKRNPTLTAGAGGFRITSADKKFELRFGGLLQVDSRNYFGDDLQPKVNDILIRRNRLDNRVKLGDKLDLRFQIELATPGIVDAYADLKLLPGLKATVGRFKTPISLENHRGDPARDFVEAGFPIGLATVRDNGLWLEYSDAEGAFSLGGGVFNGGVDGATVTNDTNDDKEAVGKLFIHPARFFDTVSFRDFGFGVAASSGHRVPGSAVASYRNTAQQNVTSYQALTTVQDQSFRIAPQAYYFDGPLSLLGEYVRSTDFGTNTTNALTAGGLQTAILAREAWQVTAGWVLTGEPAAFNGVRWNKQSTGDWGVWQLVGRYQEFQVDAANVHLQPTEGPSVGAAARRFVNPRASATKIQGWSAGLNWIPLENAKIYVTFDQNIYTDGASKTVDGVLRTINRETDNILFVRTQFTY